MLCPSYINIARADEPSGRSNYAKLKSDLAAISRMESREKSRKQGDTCTSCCSAFAPSPGIEQAKHISTQGPEASSLASGLLL